MKGRVLLDTNVWRYVVDAGAKGQLLRLGREAGIAVQVAPGVVYETLRLKDPELRRSLISLMVDRRFTRLMPEAYSESIEILDAVSALRPEWLRETPDIRYVRRLYRDWTLKTGAGFWKRCATAPDREAEFVRNDRLMEEGYRAAQEARKEMIDIGWRQAPSFGNTLAGFGHQILGWDGEPVAVWRWDSLIGLSNYLRQVGNPYRDWIGPFVDVDGGLLNSASWRRFWLHDVNEHAVPRQWLRAAHSFAQRFRKVTTGSLGDTQLVTYLVETDVFVTADKALIKIIEDIRREAPIRLPECLLVEGGRDGLKATLASLLELGRVRRA